MSMMWRTHGDYLCYLDIPDLRVSLLVVNKSKSGIQGIQAAQPLLRYLAIRLCGHCLADLESGGAAGVAPASALAVILVHIQA